MKFISYFKMFFPKTQFLHHLLSDNSYFMRYEKIICIYLCSCVTPHLTFESIDIFLQTYLQVSYHYRQTISNVTIHQHMHMINMHCENNTKYISNALNFLISVIPYIGRPSPFLNWKY
jgi:hypothetical protein